jgi:tellurite resistance protein
VVFRAGSDAPEVPSDGYAAAALLLHFAAMVVAADGEIAAAEQERLDAHIGKGLDLSHGERTRLSAHLKLILRQPPGWSGTQKRISALSEPQRRGIGKFIVQVASADGRVDPEEVKVLTKGFKLLGLDPATVHDELHAASLAVSPPADEPVTVKQGTPELATAIPRRPEANVEVGADAKHPLDMRLVSARLRETASVSALLASVFAEEVAPPAVAAAEAASDRENIGGLDGPHSDLLRRLGAKPSWPRVEYERLAEEFGLLPDGAIDRLNETAFETCGAPLVEGDDPMEVDISVYQELVK